MRSFPYLIATLLSASITSVALGEPDERPDILVILVDDLGWHDVGFTGGQSHETPNIDAFAERAMIFENAYSDAPNCAPTRASLLTGLATPRHGIITVGSSKRGKAENRRIEPVPNKTTLDPKTPTLSGLLRDAGWRTVHIGKFHVGADPLDYGFTDQVGGTSAGHPKSYSSPYKNKALTDGPEGEYLTDRLASEAVTFLEADDDRPIFLYLSFYAVHTPIQARADLLKTARVKNPTTTGRAQKYDAMVAAVDEAVGRVLDGFDRRERPRLIVFASDNGGYGPCADNGQLRGAKGMLYEGGIRIPMAIHWPGQELGASTDYPVLLRDLAPTILDVSGVAQDEVLMDGQSLVSLLDEIEPTDRSLHWHFPVYLEAYSRTTGTWRTTPAAAVRDGRYKLVEFFEDGQVELYDLEVDPSEQVNIAESNEAVVVRLRSDMERWRAHVGAVLPTPLDVSESEAGEAVSETLKGDS